MLNPYQLSRSEVKSRSIEVRLFAMTDNFQRITRAKARSLSVPPGKAANAAIHDAAEADHTEIMRRTKRPWSQLPARRPYTTIHIQARLPSQPVPYFPNRRFPRASALSKRLLLYAASVTRPVRTTLLYPWPGPTNPALTRLQAAVAHTPRIPLPNAVRPFKGRHVHPSFLSTDEDADSLEEFLWRFKIFYTLHGVPASVWPACPPR